MESIALYRATVKATRPTRDDELWFSAFALGRDGIEADPPAGLTYRETTEWLNGFGWGQVQNDEEPDATFLRELAQAEREAHDVDPDDPYGEGSLR